MIAASVGFAAQIDGQATTVDCRVTLTLPAAASSFNDVTALVESMTLGGSLTTDMPEGTRIITGQAAMSGEVVIGGPALTGLIAALNPYNTASPLYRTTIEGVPVLIEYGLVVAGVAELVPALYGTLDSYSVDMRAGTITLRVIERNRQAARGAVVGLQSFLGHGGYHGEPGLTSGYVADAVLRSIGLYTSPPPRANALIYASMHGSIYPEVYDAANTVLYTYPYVTWPGGTSNDIASMTQGKWGAEVAPGGLIYTAVSLADATQRLGVAGSDVGYMIELNVQVRPVSASQQTIYKHTVTGFGSAPNSDFSLVSVIQLAGTANIQFAWQHRRNGVTTSYAGVGTALTSAVGAWVHTVAVVKFPAAAPTTVELTGYMDTAVRVTAGTSRAIGALSAVATDSTVQIVELQAWCPAENYQYALDLAPNVAYGYTFTPTAFMDKSTLMLTVVPPIEAGKDAWAILQEFAAAEQGAWVPDSIGRPQFKSRKTIASAAAVRSVVGTTNLLALTQEISAASKADRIRQPLTEWAAEPIGFAWEADQIISLEPYETRTMRVELDYTAVDVYPWTAYADYPLGVYPADATRFRISTTADGVGSTLQFDGTSVDIQTRSLGPTTIELKLVNRQGVKIWFVSPGYMTDITQAGTPYLKIGGRKLKPLTSGGTTIESTRGAGTTVLDLPANRFVQTPAGAQARTDALLSDLSRVRPVWRDVRIVADPRLQIGDKVTLTDLEVNGISGETAIIVALDASLSESDWTQTVDLRALGTPGGWLLAVAGRGEMGVNTYA